MRIEKPLVIKHFNNGLQSYNSHALIQKQITCEMIQMIVDLGFKDFRKAFEVGCGTGFLTRRLIENLLIDKLIVNDITSISENHINNISRKLNKDIEFLCGDAEKILMPQKNCAIFSSSTIQWFNGLSSFFDKVSINLKKQGLFAFSTFGTNNFKEIKSSTGIGLKYYDLKSLETLLSQNYNILDKKEWTQALEFEHPISVLQHMKKTGVNGISRRYFGKKQLSDFIQNYLRNYSTVNSSVTLTYNPIIIIAQKK